MTDQTIILGDAISELPKLQSETFDLVIADPPYNLGKDYVNNHDVKRFEDYLDFSRLWLNQVYRLLKPNGTIYVFVGFRFISYLYDILDRELGMCFNSWIVWHYTQRIGKTRGFLPVMIIFSCSQSLRISYSISTRFECLRNITESAITCGELIPAMYGSFRMSTIATRGDSTIQPGSRKV